MGLAVNSYLLPTSKSRDTKTGKKLLPNVRIRGHLPAPIFNGGGDSP